MGVGAIAFRLYERLIADGWMRRGQSMIELGAQEITPGASPVRMAVMLGAEDCEHDGSARSLMTKLGFVDYQCIDTNGMFGAWQWDLNKPTTLPSGQTWDIVTNHGTTEHVFDQANCFRLMHDLCAVDGLMIHCVPMRGYGEHCFYRYNKLFFERIAVHNSYHVLVLDEAIDREFNPDPESKKHEVLSVVAFHKVIVAPFEPPQQVCEEWNKC